jgi:hypothetical protein
MKELNFEQMAAVNGGDDASCAGAIATAVVFTLLGALGGSIFGAVAGVAAGAALIDAHC